MSDPTASWEAALSRPRQLTREEVQALIAAGKYQEVTDAKKHGALDTLLGIRRPGTTEED